MWKLFVVLKFSLEPIWFYLVQYFKAMGFLFFCISALSLKLSVFLMLIPSQENCKRTLFFDACLVRSYKLVLPWQPKLALTRDLKGRNGGSRQIVKSIDGWIDGRINFKKIFLCLIAFFANTVKFAKNLFSLALKQIGSNCRALDCIYCKIWKYSLSVWKAWNSYNKTWHVKSLLTLQEHNQRKKRIGQSCSFLLAIAHFCNLAGSQNTGNTYTVSFGHMWVSYLWCF